MFSRFVFLFILAFSFTALAQTKPHPQLKKFAFMQGAFKERKSDGVVTASFSTDGKEFRWEYKNASRTSVGVITYDAAAKKYWLVETVNGTQATYYEGMETQHGFPFRALTGKGGAPDEKGDVIQLMPIPQIGAMPDTKMVNMVRLRKNDEGKYEKYYDGMYYALLSAEQLAKANSTGLKRMEFLVGKFKEDGRDGEVIGKLEGDKYMWSYKSSRNTSEAVATYDFHSDRFTLIEKIGSSETTYEGSFQDGKLVLWTDATTRQQLILSAPEYGKVLMVRKAKTVTNYEGTYTKVEPISGQ
jgi:hypothetical protein